MATTVPRAGEHPGAFAGMLLATITRRTTSTAKHGWYSGWNAIRASPHWLWMIHRPHVAKPPRYCACTVTMYERRPMAAQRGARHLDCTYLQLSIVSAEVASHYWPGDERFGLGPIQEGN